MRTIFTVILCLSSIISYAQSLRLILAANVRYSTDNITNSYILSPEQESKGFFERIEMFEIDNSLYFRIEDGKYNPSGVAENGFTDTIWFGIRDLTFEWIDPTRNQGILFKGKCYIKQQDRTIPFSLTLNGSNTDVNLSIGRNVKILKTIENYDINRLFVLGKEISNYNTNPQSSSTRSSHQKQKPTLTK